jgi:hypothetical protein
MALFASTDPIGTVKTSPDNKHSHKLKGWTSGGTAIVDTFSFDGESGAAMDQTARDAAMAAQGAANAATTAAAAAQAQAAAALSRAGGTMTGPLTLGSWAQLAVTSGGEAMYGQNVIYDPTTGTFNVRYSSSIGWSLLRIWNNTLLFAGVTGNVVGGAPTSPAWKEVAHAGNISSLIAAANATPIKSWACIHGTTGAIKGAGNVSSTVRNSLGSYTMNFPTQGNGYGYDVTPIGADFDIVTRTPTSITVNTYTPNTRTLADAQELTILIIN